jgi:hypothetical protein
MQCLLFTTEPVYTIVIRTASDASIAIESKLMYSQEALAPALLLRLLLLCSPSPAGPVCVAC